MNGCDKFRSLCPSFPWHTILHKVFPGDNPASAMTARGECMMTQAYILKNKVLSLLVTPPKPNLLVTFFIAENNHHWIHSVLMTYICQRRSCSKNKRTDSSLNICSLAIFFLSLNSGAVKLLILCFTPNQAVATTAGGFLCCWKSDLPKQALSPFFCHYILPCPCCSCGGLYFTLFVC